MDFSNLKKAELEWYTDNILYGIYVIAAMLECDGNRSDAWKYIVVNDDSDIYSMRIGPMDEDIAIPTLANTITTLMDDVYDVVCQWFCGEIYDDPEGNGRFMWLQNTHLQRFYQLSESLYPWKGYKDNQYLKLANKFLENQRYCWDMYGPYQFVPEDGKLYLTEMLYDSNYYGCDGACECCTIALLRAAVTVNAFRYIEHALPRMEQDYDQMQQSLSELYEKEAA